MNAARLQRALASLLADDGSLADIAVFDELDSTSTYLGNQPPPNIDAAHAVLALHQTAGRGRRGKTWKAPAGSGLFLSIAYTYREMPREAAALTLAIGVAVARALERIGAGEIMLKWPNDLVWQDRKLGGILVESNLRADGRFVIVAGVGINMALPADFTLSAESTSWAKGAVDLAHAGVTPGHAALAREVIPEVVNCLASFPDTDLAQTIASFNRRHWLLERAATLDKRMVRCDAVCDDGRLRVVDMLNGSVHDIDSADVVPLAWSDPS
ncbi:MAG: biotin--[acetyl-CoA-carboxylase] ligase [Pseudomonadota bacterium]